MQRNEAIKILKDDLIDIDDLGLFSLGKYLGWSMGDDKAVLDGKFSSGQLKAIAWWMDNASSLKAQTKTIESIADW